MSYPPVGAIIRLTRFDPHFIVEYPALAFVRDENGNHIDIVTGFKATSGFTNEGWALATGDKWEVVTVDDLTDDEVAALMKWEMTR